MAYISKNTIMVRNKLRSMLNPDTVGKTVRIKSPKKDEEYIEGIYKIVGIKKEYGLYQARIIDNDKLGKNVRLVKPTEIVMEN